MVWHFVQDLGTALLRSGLERQHRILVYPIPFFWIRVTFFEASCLLCLASFSAPLYILPLRVPPVFRLSILMERTPSSQSLQNFYLRLMLSLMCRLFYLLCSSLLVAFPLSAPSLVSRSHVLHIVIYSPFKPHPAFPRHCYFWWAIYSRSCGQHFSFKSRMVHFSLFVSFVSIYSE